MLRGLYSAASGMMTQQRKHDSVTNNIANLNTPGYKQVSAVSRSFPEMLISLVGSGDGSPTQSIGRLNMGTMVEENVSIFMQGDLQETGQAGDFALVSNIQPLEDGDASVQPQAFFTVWNNEDEQRFTRNGKFLVTAEGELRTTDGFRVLDNNNEPIILDVAIDQVRVSNNGLLYNSETSEPILNIVGEPITLLISQVDQPYQLIREGNGVFRLDNPDEFPARPVDNMDEIQVYQGFIERSNVDAAQATIDMMVALRAYEANQRVIQYYDRSLEKAVNEIGRV